MWALSVSTMSHVGPALCVQLSRPAAALSQSPGAGRPPQPPLEGRFLVWPLGLVDEPEAGTAATSSDALRQSLGTLALLPSEA